MTNPDHLLARANPVPNPSSSADVQSTPAEAMLESTLRADHTVEVADATWSLHESLHVELFETTAIVTLDDGGPNVLTLDLIEALMEAVTSCEADDEIRVLVLTGRDRVFSAGLHRDLFAGPDQQARQTTRALAELAVTAYDSTIPIVAACTGHAIAAGALLLLAADIRIGIAGTYQIGLNEVEIGLPVPTWAVQLARERLARNHLQKAVATAHLYSPVEAVQAGFLDTVVDADPTAHAVQEARRLAAIDPEAYEVTILAARSATARRIRGSLDELHPIANPSGERAR